MYKETVPYEKHKGKLYLNVTSLPKNPAPKLKGLGMRIECTWYLRSENK
jgi:hypothetical protein